MNTPPAGWRLRTYDELPSTADLIRQLAEGGEADRLAVLARRQTAGRGTHGRHWRSPEGNLYLSVLLRPEVEGREVPQWSLLAAVALHAALRPWAGPGLTLKWPNDLLLGGAKCAGILSEASLGPEGRTEWLTFGLGVNLAHAPDLADRRTAALPPPAPRPEAVAIAVLEQLDHWRRIRDMEGFGSVRAAWTSLGHAMGDPLRVSSGTRLIAGLFEGLDEVGGLRLRTAEGVRTITAGAVEA